MGILSKRAGVSARRWAILVGLVVALAVISSVAFAKTGDLRTPGASETINGAIFEQLVPPGSSGSGVWHSFVRVSTNDPIEHGYNSDYRPKQFDEDTSKQFNRSILLSIVPTVEREETLYREFRLDINQNTGIPAQYISLNQVEIYTTDDANITGYDPITKFGTNADPRYSMDVGPDGNSEVFLDYTFGSGSGTGDMILLVPDSNFPISGCEYGAASCSTYVVLYSQFGDDYPNNDGFEEWALYLRPVVDVSKDTTGTYDRDIDWLMEKLVTPLSASGSAGDSFDFDYTVDYTKNPTESNFAVTGTILITNPTGNKVPPLYEGIDAIIDSVDDVISDYGGAVTVDCDGVEFPYTLHPGDDPLECSYSASEATGPNPFGDLNTATVTVSSGYGDETAEYDATAPITFSAVTTGDESVTVDDSNSDDATSGVAPAGESISDSSTYGYVVPQACSTDASDYTNGHYQITWPNTATAVGDSTDLSDTETVTVDCYLDALEVSKTAAGEWDRTVGWTLAKSVDPDSHSGSAGELAGNSTWTVVADKTDSGPGNFTVAGTITVDNPAAIPQDFTVGDVLNDGDSTAASVTCPASTVPAGGTVECSYEALPADASADLNTATVSAVGNADQIATADVDWTENLTGYDSGLLTDPRFAYSQPISGDKTETFDEDFSCSADASDYTNGHYQYTETNWAYLNDNIDLDASASVTVDCYLDALEVSKTAAGEWDRTVGWTLAKSVDPDSHSGSAGELAGNSTWTVVAEKTDSGPGNFTVAGTITVDNPAAIPQDFTVGDVLNDGDSTAASVTCPASTVPAGGTVECSYEALPADASADLNTATVSAVGNADQIATADVDWTENLTGYDSGLLTDPRFAYSQPISGDKTETFDEDFSCSADASDYTNGHYQYTETNWAYLNDNIDLDASASVTVDCYLDALEVSKTAAGEWDRTVGWTLAKSVDPDSHSGSAGELAGNSTWTVVAEKTDSGPGNFTVAGTITVDNPAAIPQDFTVGDVLNDGDSTAASVTCPASTVPAGGTVECSYEALPADASADLNTATVSAVGNADQIATADVDWTENLTGYDSGLLTDPRFAYSQPISGDKTETFDEDFSCSADASDYTNGHYQYTETNWAYLNDNIDLDASASVTVDCYAPVVSKTADTTFNRYWAWEITKVADQTSLTLQPGQTFLVDYTIGVTATSDDDDHAVSGIITVDNPNPDSSMTVTVSDAITGIAGPVAVDCDPGAGVSDQLTVVAAGSGACTYASDLPDDTTRTNTATATLATVDFDSDGVPVTFDLANPTDEIDECVLVTDPTLGVSTTICADDADKTINVRVPIGPYTVEECGRHEILNTAGFITNDDGMTGEAMWTIIVDIPCPYCTLTPGYWKTHNDTFPGGAPPDDTWDNIDYWQWTEGPPEAWSFLSGGTETTLFFKSGQSYYDVLWTAPKGNVYYNLSFHYIAAQLNMEAGAGTTAGVTAAFDAATGFFMDYTPAEAAKFKGNNPKRKDAIMWAGILADYNEGNIAGIPHCSEDFTSG